MNPLSDKNKGQDDKGKDGKGKNLKRHSDKSVKDTSGSDDSDLELDESKKARVEKPGSSGVTDTTKILPPSFDLAAKGINPTMLQSITSRSTNLFNQVLEEESRNKSFTFNSPSTSSSTGQYKAPTIAPNINSINQESGNDQSTSNCRQVDLNEEKEKKESIKELLQICNLYSLDVEKVKILIHNYSKIEIDSFKAGLVFCFKNLFKFKNDYNNDMLTQFKKISASQINIEQELKNLRASIGTPLNIIKSIEKKIDDSAKVKDTQINNPVVQPSILPTSSNPPSLLNQSVVSGASTSGILSTRGPVTSKGSIATPDEHALMLKKDAETLRGRGLDYDLAKKIDKILHSNKKNLGVYQDAILKKLRVEFDLKGVGQNPKFRETVDKILKKLDY